MPSVLRFDYREYAIRASLNRKELGRRLSGKRPPISEGTVKKIAWAEEHNYWTGE
jgi:hypothetical protein